MFPCNSFFLCVRGNYVSWFLLMTSGLPWWPVVKETHPLMVTTLNVVASVRMCVCVFSCSTMSDSFGPWTVACQAHSGHRIFQARILEWICHFLLWGIFPTQEWSPCLLCLLHLAGRSFTPMPPGKPLLKSTRGQLENVNQQGQLSAQWMSTHNKGMGCFSVANLF